MSIYGFDQFNLPLNFKPILVPQFLLAQDNRSSKFGLGFRELNDDLIYFHTQTSRQTDRATNHSITFTARVEHYITYVSFSVDVSVFGFMLLFYMELIFFFTHTQSKTAGATFLRLSNHEFDGMVYDFNTKQLFANMYVYGYKIEQLPPHYLTNLMNLTTNVEVTAGCNRSFAEFYLLIILITLSYVF